MTETRWIVYRGYGVRDSVSGARLWCYSADQQQSSLVAHEVASALNTSDEAFEAKFCGCGDQLDARLGAACANCQAAEADQ